MKPLVLLGCMAISVDRQPTSFLRHPSEALSSGSSSFSLGKLSAAQSFHRVREGFPSLAIFGTCLTSNGWPRRSAGMNMVGPHVCNVPRSVLIHRSGEMMYISALGKGFLVLNSQRIAADLLDKRSNIYSSRPHYISANDYLTENMTLVLSPYCDLYTIDT